MRLLYNWVLLACALLPAIYPLTAFAAPDEKQEILKRGRAIAAHCAASEAHPIFLQFDAGMAAAVTEDKLAEVLKGVLAQGKIGKVESEDAGVQHSMRAYTAVCQWGAGKIAINVAFDDKWRVSGLVLRPTGMLPPDPKAGYKTKAKLRLPFDGEWFVFWGGDTLAQNYHVIARDQRHAYDILIVRNGLSHKGSGEQNADYYAFGLPVLAPADGTVVTAVDGIKDNVPGEMNRGQIYGNHVVIDLGQGEFAVICHFKQGSLKVKAGDHIRAGQILALCGNSGNSSEAHVHFHVQDRKELGFAATGLPAPFSNYLANGKAGSARRAGQGDARAKPLNDQAIDDRRWTMDYGLCVNYWYLYTCLT